MPASNDIENHTIRKHNLSNNQAAATNFLKRKRGTNLVHLFCSIDSLLDRHIENDRSFIPVRLIPIVKLLKNLHIEINASTKSGAKFLAAKNKYNNKTREHLQFLSVFHSDAPDNIACIVMLDDIIQELENGTNAKCACFYLIIECIILALEVVGEKRRKIRDIVFEKAEFIMYMLSGKAIKPTSKHNDLEDANSDKQDDFIKEVELSAA